MAKYLHASKFGMATKGLWVPETRCALMRLLVLVGEAVAVRDSQMVVGLIIYDPI